MMMKMIQSAFAQPDVSWRRKMSAKTVIRSQIQITNAKKMSMYQNAVNTGVLLASKLPSTVPPYLVSYLFQATLPRSCLGF